MNYPKENKKQIKNETIDRSIKHNCWEYFRRYPAYAEEVFGHIPSDKEIKEFFETYKDMFVEDSLKSDRRRL